MKNKKNDVLFICQFFYPEYISSATLPFDMAKKLSDEGYNVGALCGYPKEYIDKKVPLNEAVDNVDIKRVKYIQFSRSGFLHRIINFLSFSMAIAVKFNTVRKYKVVYVFSNPPILPFIVSAMKKICNIKIIHVLYDVYPEIGEKTNAYSTNGILSKVIKKCNDFAYKKFDQVLVISTDMKDYICESRQIKKEKVSSIPVWYKDTFTENIIEPKDTRMFKEFTKEDFIVSYLGNMGTCQDLETIIECIKNTPEKSSIKYLFAGHGNKFDEIKKLSRQGILLNTFCYDFLQGQDFKDIMSISNCYIVSLVEGLCGLCSPSKVPSYLMEKKPVICIMDSKSEIAMDIMENDAGYVVGNNDFLELFRCVNELKNDDKKLNLKSESARKIFLRKYEKNICLNLHLENLKDIIK